MLQCNSKKLFEINQPGRLEKTVFSMVG